MGSPQKTALVVDDSKTARVILQQMLEQHDLAVAGVASAEEALEYLRQHRPDVIFMDHRMPDTDGLEAVTAITGDPRTATIPVLMYTAKHGDVYLGQARAAGAIGIISKQARPGELYQVLLGLGLVSDRRLAASDPRAKAPSPVSEAQGGPDGAAAGGGAGARLFQQQPGPLADAVIERIASRTARHVDVGAVRVELVALLDEYLARISQEVAALRRDTRRSLTEIAEQAADRTYDRRLQGAAAERPAFAAEQVAASRWRSWLVALAALVIFTTIGISGLAVYQSAAVAHAHRDDGATAMLLDTVGWAVNRNGSFRHGQPPFDDQRLAEVRELVSRLTGAGFRGTVRLLGHVGRFCLQGSFESGYGLAAADLAAGLCNRIGQPEEEAVTLAGATSHAFAQYLQQLADRPSAPVRVEILSLGDDQPLIPYPPPQGIATAGHWNAIAARNNRIEVQLIPDRPQPR